MKLNEYTSAELVRLELLMYENPDGLHPVESNWRDLSRKLLEDIKILEESLSKHSHRYENEHERCRYCSLENKLPRQFPTKFEGKIKI